MLFGEAGSAALIDGVERVHQTVAEGIGVDIERRMDEMRDVGPIIFVEPIELERRAETFALDLKPDLVEAVGRQLGGVPLVMKAALELDGSDLPHHRGEHGAEPARD